MPIYRPFNEITIGDYNNNFRVDILDRRTKHGSRLKVTRKGGKSIKSGTSVPIIPNVKTYDEIINHPSIEKLPESEKAIPVISGFIALYHNDLLLYSNSLASGDIKTQNGLRNKIEDAWDRYIAEFGDANESTIRKYIDKMTKNK